MPQRIATSLALCLLYASCLPAIGQQATPEAQPSPAGPPPVTIRLDAAGNLVLESDDPRALDRLEEWMQLNRPPRRPYDVFKVKHARASWIKLNLDDYFQKEKDGNDRPNFGYFFFGYDQPKEEEKTRQLGDKPPLKFISDNDTNSIVVQGADDLDRQTIQQLIELWDVPEPVSDADSRFTRLVRVRYSRAEAIAAALKEAYRDLLSANDKTFQAAEEGKREGNAGGVEAGGGMSFAFKGKLSLGVDSVTNSILVSAEGKPLLDLVSDMVQKLDMAAQPQGNFQVYQLTPDVNGESVREALMALLATPKQQQPPSKQPNSQQNNAQHNNAGGNQGGQQSRGRIGSSSRGGNGS